MTAYETIHYLADDSKWGNALKNAPSVPNGTLNMRKMPLLEAWGEFKRIAEQGHIHAIGRLGGVGPHVPIPEIYWMSAILHQSSLDNPALSETMPSVANPDGIPIYKDVRILRADVERIWPSIQ